MLLKANEFTTQIPKTLPQLQTSGPNAKRKKFNTKPKFPEPIEEEVTVCWSLSSLQHIDNGFIKKIRDDLGDTFTKDDDAQANAMKVLVKRNSRKKLQKVNSLNNLSYDSKEAVIKVDKSGNLRKQLD